MTMTNKGVANKAGTSLNISKPVNEDSVRNSFVAVGLGDPIFLRRGKIIAAEVRGLTAGSGECRLLRSIDGGVNYVVIPKSDLSGGLVFAGDSTFDIIVDDDAFFRWECSARASGTFVATIGRP